MANLAARYRTSAYEYTGYLNNIHDISSYYRANMDMIDKKKRDLLLYGNQKIITRIRNEVGTYFSDNSKVRNSMLATGCKIRGEVDSSIVSRRVEIDDNSKVKKSVIMSNCHLGKNSRVEFAILDKNVVVADNVVVKGSPEKPIVVKKGTVINKDLVNE